MTKLPRCMQPRPQPSAVAIVLYDVANWLSPIRWQLCLLAWALATLILFPE